ncbi:SDR family oxidoreductase [Pseudopedobacter saltans]|nr:SDR family oxidoreductase [Pseudopedobacter saltans]
MKKDEKKVKQPEQKQTQQPGKEYLMNPEPEYKVRDSKDFFKGKTVLITGGDSGIGRAISVAFAHEGANIAIAYLNEHEDAKRTKELVEKEGSLCLVIPGDVGMEKHCQEIVEKTVEKFGTVDILINNAALQFPQKEITDISAEQLKRTFDVNIFSQFYMVSAALKYLKKGSSIINTASVTAYRGSPELLDYSATKGAIVAFTRSLSMSLMKKGIRVNAVAPGPIWTPLIPATFDKEKVSKFGSDSPMGRVGQPNEVASCYVFLASQGASYISGQVLHPNGGESVNT